MLARRSLVCLCVFYICITTNYEGIINLLNDGIPDIFKNKDWKLIISNHARMYNAFILKLEYWF